MDLPIGMRSRFNYLEIWGYVNCSCREGSELVMFTSPISSVSDKDCCRTQRWPSCIQLGDKSSLILDLDLAFRSSIIPGILLHRYYLVRICQRGLRIWLTSGPVLASLSDLTINLFSRIKELKQEKTRGLETAPPFSQ